MHTVVNGHRINGTTVGGIDSGAGALRLSALAIAFIFDDADAAVECPRISSGLCCYVLILKT